jgi:hypothetical protein
MTQSHYTSQNAVDGEGQDMMISNSHELFGYMHACHQWLGSAQRNAEERD